MLQSPACSAALLAWVGLGSKPPDEGVPRAASDFLGLPLDAARRRCGSAGLDVVVTEEEKTSGYFAADKPWYVVQQ